MDGEIDLNGYDPISESASAAQDYLLDTGFWFEMCMNIQEAFAYCQPGRKAPTENNVYPAYETCGDPSDANGSQTAGGFLSWITDLLHVSDADQEVSQGTPSDQEKCQFVNFQRENRCRNRLLMYKSQSNQTQQFWEAIESERNFRKSLVR